jgi:hypothetical protein
MLKVVMNISYSRARMDTVEDAISELFLTVDVDSNVCVLCVCLLIDANIYKTAAFVPAIVTVNSILSPPPLPSISIQGFFDLHFSVRSHFGSRNTIVVLEFRRAHRTMASTGQMGVTAAIQQTAVHHQQHSYT